MCGDLEGGGGIEVGQGSIEVENWEMAMHIFLENFLLYLLLHFLSTPAPSMKRSGYTLSGWASMIPYSPPKLHDGLVTEKLSEEVTMSNLTYRLQSRLAKTN